MTNFRQPKKSNKPISSIDGFIRRDISSTTNNTKINSRFQTTYRPTRSADDFSLKTKSESFTPRNTNEFVLQNNSSQQNNVTESFGSSEIDDTKKHRFNRSKRVKREKNKKISFQKIAKGFAIVFVALIIGVSSLFAYGYIKARNIFKGDGEGAAALQQDVDPAKLNGEGDGRVNILLLGKGGEGETAPDLTDTLLLASIDPVQNEAALVSVPRDMYVKNQSGYSMKINAIYSTAKQARLANGSDSTQDLQAAEDAGLNAIKNSVSEVLGVPVHYYVMVDFKAFEDAINTVGGINVDVKEPLYDQSVAWLLGGNPLVAGEGLQTFDGKRALLYARSRKGSSRGDFDRTARQQEIIVALQNKVMSLGTFSNPFKVAELLGSFGNRVRTDLNGLSEIKRLYEIGQQIGSDRIANVGLADPPSVLVATDNIGGQSVVVPIAGLYNYEDIHSYIRNNLRDAFLKSEDARVLILNGTSTAGLASATSKELKSYGYNVVRVDNAPTDNYVQNQLIDLTNGQKRYTKSYLERRLELTSTTQIPVGLPDATEVDFIIILGTDEIIKTTN
jgi:polyisoprenyl-teichoic acid--peptidoglycan teichoic acid transferase